MGLGSAGHHNIPRKALAFFRASSFLLAIVFGARNLKLCYQNQFIRGLGCFLMHYIGAAETAVDSGFSSLASCKGEGRRAIPVPSSACSAWKLETKVACC